MIDRQQLRALAVRASADFGPSLALWEGGSTATGHTDDRSDIDLVWVVEDGDDDDAFAVMETALDGVGLPRRTVLVPEPTSHGGRQRFYRLVGLPEDWMVDLVVFTRATFDPRLLEPERHGEAVVILDREGLLVTPDFDAADHAARLRAELGRITGAVDMFSHLVDKALARGAPLDALGFYSRFVISSLVTVLGMVHRPLRYDFGLRYLHRDLPADVARRLERLAWVADPEALAVAMPEALAWFRETAAAVDTGEARIAEASRRLRTGKKR